MLGSISDRVNERRFARFQTTSSPVRFEREFHTLDTSGTSAIKYLAILSDYRILVILIIIIIRQMSILNMCGSFLELVF